LPFLPIKLCDADGRIAEVGLGQQVHAVAHVGLNEVMGQHGVETGGGDLHAIFAQHTVVVLEILGHEGLVGGGENGCKLGTHLHGGLLVLWNSDIESLAFLGAERDAEQLGLQGVEPCGLGIETNDGALLQMGDQFLALLCCVDQLVVVRLGGDGAVGIGLACAFHWGTCHGEHVHLVGIGGLLWGRWCGSGLHGHLATQHPAGNGAEFQLCEQLGEQVSIYLFHDEFLLVKIAQARQGQ
jgi:hypothetical protein